MRDFTICIGTTFVFGRDAETKVGDELGAKGVSRVLIHHDGGAYLETSGLLDAVRRSLGRAGISYTELGGVKEAIFSVEGAGAYNRLKYESGVHRVQRVPETETQGRIHTSTAEAASSIRPRQSRWEPPESVTYGIISPAKCR